MIQIQIVYFKLNFFIVNFYDGFLSHIRYEILVLKIEIVHLKILKQGIDQPQAATTKNPRFNVSP